MPTFGLVDCNNFYASCERVFQPDLVQRPVVVLSNNDGCVIARSQEAKAVGIPMGAPLFKIREIIKDHDVVVRSSNYALYGDLSERVMSLLAEEAPRVEIYSIDECFLDLHKLAVPDLAVWCAELRRKVRLWTGIPVSVGIGPTKTLAKLANKLAKSSPRAGGVLDLVHHPDWIEPALRKTKVGDVWGIGRRWSAMLEERGIKTALDLSRAQDGWVRQRMGIVGLRTVHELRGIACHDLETQPPPKQTTCCSRSFGKAVAQREEVHSAVLSFAERVAEKTRAANQVAGALQVFLSTDRFNTSAPQYSSAATLRFLVPTADSRDILKAASNAFGKIWKPGFAYRKAGVILLDLSTPDAWRGELFDQRPQQSDDLMQAVDVINQRHGRGAIAFGLAPKSRPAHWAMKQDMLSPHYTTCWSELAVARAADHLSGPSR
ncbi:Y-family DNA polymerase [Thioclava sp. A2]|uniref:Y-family DNA polymerase n=1 Tax=Thioclava sp. FCG-A2 TaxID=3080562 RepID=UPI0029554D43|nr:Y-family DNA polymerase [Thioclava sp. A2]MDV7272110.1 Y-family DNA polymerase [Thioclava sp. A2]